LTDKASRQGLTGLRVEAWDLGRKSADCIAQSMTDAEGCFQLLFTAAELKKQFMDATPDVFFKIYQGEQLIKNTEDVILWEYQEEETEVVIQIEAASQPGPANVFRVTGRVLYADARPVIGAAVNAYDQGLESRKALGQPAMSDQSGAYEIIYTVNDLLLPAKGSANLLVQASYQGENIPPEPSVIYNAKPEEIVDLIVAGKELQGPSEFTQVKAHPILVARAAEKPLKNWTAENIQVVAQDTGLDARKIAALVSAENLAIETSFNHPEIFNALIRQNLPATRVGMLSQSPEVLRRTLESVQRDNLISEEELRASGGIDGVLAKFKELIVDHAFLPTGVAGKYNLSELLSKTTPLSEALQRKFFGLYVNHTGTTPEFWEKVGEDAELKAHVPALQRGLQLGVLTLNHVPLVVYLHQQPLPNLRVLAQNEANDWLALLEANKLGAPPDMPGANKEERKQSYATTLTRIFEDTYPTAVIANRLQRDPSAPFTAERKGVLQKFFEQAPEFEFVAQHVDDFVQAHPEAVQGISAEEKTALLKDLKSVQRLYKVMPQYERYANMRPLLAANLNSSQKISLQSKTHFVKQYAAALGGQAQAEQVYNNARHVAATTLNLYARFSARYNNIQLPVIGNPVVSPNGNAAANRGSASLALMAEGSDPFPTEPGTGAEIPSWTELFGPFHLCDCEHCRSVYSPAAYLTDVLHFLDPDLRGTNPAIRKLMERRPDLAEIELSCKNSNTVLPYIDLVNEILENAVAPELFSIEDTADAINAMVGELDASILPIRFGENLDALGLPLSANPLITTKTTGREWLINDAGNIYRAEKIIGEEKIVVAMTPPQTRGTAEALSVAPENVNPAAYRKLSEAIYPFSLPWDLPTAQARVYLQHLGMPRYQLMETFQKGPDLEPTDLEIASEYLGFNTIERQVITSNLPDEFLTPHEPWDFWGLEEDNNVVPDLENAGHTVMLNWLDVLRRVPELMKRANLSFAELAQALNTRFLNPLRFNDSATGVDIKFPGTDCEVERAEIQLRGHEGSWARIDDATLTAMLDKMHRFVRLWRKLGWSMKELDQTITALNPGDLTEDFIKQLAALKRLQTEIKKPLTEILSWWAKLDTEDYNYEGLPESKSFYQQLFLNKAVVNPEDRIFMLNDAGDELAMVGYIIPHLATIAAALGISVEELARLRTSEPTSDAGGLSAAYFENADLRGRIKPRLDAQLNFSSSSAWPAEANTSGPFSVRWTGKIEADGDGMHTLFVHTDGGIRLWIGNQLLINEWHDRAITEPDYEAAISLVGGRPKNIRLSRSQFCQPKGWRQTIEMTP